MRVIHFKYQKDKDLLTEPQVLVFHEDKELLEGIDITKFEPKEVLALFDIQRLYEKQIKDFIDKGFRRYRKDKIKDIMGESNEPSE